MSKQTAAASKIDCNEERATLMMAMELGESGWLLGFASAFGQKPLRRKIPTRDGAALLAQIVWAKQRLGLPEDAPVASCYEAGRDGFWLHRFLVAHGVEMNQEARAVDRPRALASDSFSSRGRGPQARATNKP